MIVVDDGIVMGYDGMLYLLLSCDIIVDLVEYMVNVYCVDVMVCILNCDKIMLGMLMVVMCFNILVIFVLGGLMEVGKMCFVNLVIKIVELKKFDFVDVMVIVVDQLYLDVDVVEVECLVCFICGLCLGMFIVNLMNCLIEVFGLLLFGNGMVVVMYVDCEQLFKCVGCCIVELMCQYYEQDDECVLLCLVGFKVFENVMMFDIVMGGLINMILYLFVIVQEVGIDFMMKDIDCLLCIVLQLCKVVLNMNKYYIEDVYCVGGIMVIFGEFECVGKLYIDVLIVYVLMLKDVFD